MKPTRIIPTKDHKAVDLEPMLKDLHALASGAATLTDQMSGQIVTFTWNDAQPAPVVALRATTKPIGVLVLSAALASRAVDPTTVSSCVPVGWAWSPATSGSSITVTTVGLLTSAVDYNITMWVIGG